MTDELANQRNWPSVQSPVTAPGVLFGYLADYWEQGMEEPPWLIFQDSAFCAGPQQWDREGMHTFAPGGQLTIFSPDGSVLWAGTFTARRRGLFSKLHPASCDWFPEGLTPETWQSFFRQDPPLRASYRPPT
jgi:hypothetical protein